MIHYQIIRNTLSHTYNNDLKSVHLLCNLKRLEVLNIYDTQQMQNSNWIKHRLKQLTSTMNAQIVLNAHWIEVSNTICS